MAEITDMVVSLLPSLIPAAIGSYLAYHFSRRKGRDDLEIEFSSRFNDRKWEAYTEFAKFLHRYLGGRRDESDDPFDDQLVPLASQILIAGSDEVVRSFRLWREAATVYGDGDNAAREELYSLVLEMRRDLGNRRTRLETETVWGVLNLNSDKARRREP
ncbi:MAG: hypothetical protein HXY42_14680 [Chloroflexi bacterium]|nr:hypothetical protein [Chloroflexota bacterium]